MAGCLVLFLRKIKIQIHISGYVFLLRDKEASGRYSPGLLF